MRIEELPGDPDGGGGGGGEGGEDEPLPRREDGDSAEGESGVVTRVVVDAKRAAVGVGARMLFYPTLVYNVVRNRFEEHFHWWDQIDEHVLLGAVPFPSDVLRLKALGVCGVVTLNESYESLVPTSLYEELVGEELWREARKLEGDLDVKLSSYARWSTQLCPRRHR